MNGFFIDPVECGAVLRAMTESGKEVTMKCEGILLPIEYSDLGCANSDLPPVALTYRYWKCSNEKCGRKVK